jgi:hypothetical protein
MLTITLPKRVVAHLTETAHTREPDEIIGSPALVKWNRWFIVPKNRFCNVYLHQWMNSDDDRALHDHPWPSISFLFAGGMFEWTFVEPGRGPAGGFRRRTLHAPAVILRGARHAHRIELFDGPMGAKTQAWTLFITGPKLREWGFHCPRGWVHWKIFSRKSGKHNEVGRGCD